MTPSLTQMTTATAVNDIELSRPATVKIESEFKEDPVHWLGENNAKLNELLLKRGAVLLKGFDPLTPEKFESFIEAASGELLLYKNRSTPRSVVQGRVYTSTEYPPDQVIPLHNENAYTHEWPQRLYFTCLMASETGGETPLADSRRVLSLLPVDLVEKFERLGVMYVRTFTPGLGLTWQETFQMTDRIQVQKYCQKHGIQVQWLSGGRLQIKQVLQAVLKHPVTKERVWFNQAHLFHVSALEKEVRQEIGRTIPEDELPRNAFLGNGEAISEPDLQAIRESYATVEYAEPWREGDILVVDNILFAHGRRPYSGPRRVIVGMT
ncbi:MAG: TauD/TfdA family dioxygenase [Orrella sp.]|jgi:alpha-ketoglutarate-dependent taurine dioxygenase|uniref:TauD/TfdA family dioxygenase n=1 Tax=Orrella sp. TaxID=1921583 RepID=UPI003BE757CD